MRDQPPTHVPAVLPALPASGVLAVVPWADPVVDAIGHDPRSAYVETYWLGILGPSTTWLLRHLVTRLERSPAGFDLALADTARALGLGDGGSRHSPFVRALTRLVQFDLGHPADPGALAVRRKVPPMSRRQLVRLPPALQERHQALQAADLRLPAFEHQRRRSRQLALSLVELGEELEAVERQLLAWRFHPALARDAAVWAWERHLRSPAAAPERAPAGDAA